MLRMVAIALGIGFLAASIAIAVAAPVAWPGALECAIFGILILVGTLLERHYRSRRPSSGAAWQSTDERFLDPSTGEFTEVRYNPQTGERSYEGSQSPDFPKI